MTCKLKNRIMQNDGLDSAGFGVKSPAVAGRCFSGQVNLVKINPKMYSSHGRHVNTRLTELGLQHISREEELKAQGAEQDLRKLEVEQIALKAEKKVAEANVIANAASICN